MTWMCLFFIGIYAADGFSQKIALPQPKTSGTVSLEETLDQRRSIRRFRPDPLSLEDVSQLLWSAQGITRDGYRRTAPSAGATYPLEVFLVVRDAEKLKPGIYHYLPEKHELQLMLQGNFNLRLQEAALEQGFVGAASINIVIAANYQRTTKRYGERGNRYVHMEAGHAGENVYLQATALGLGTVAVGAFDDERVQSLLGIKEPVLYIFPVGKKME